MRFPCSLYSAGITPLDENVVDVMVRLISHSAPCGNSVPEAEPFGMRVELDKRTARPFCLGIGVDILQDCAQTRCPTMAKELFPPVKRVSAKAKPKVAGKVMANGCAKPAAKQVRTAARSAKRVTGNGRSTP